MSSDVSHEVWDSVPAGGVPIAEAARLSGVTVHTLRYYEQSGMMPSPPARTAGGTRRYSAAELEWIHTCVKLRSLGMSTDLIRRYVDLVRAGAGNERERLQILQTQRDRVVEQMETLRRDLTMIEGKIAVYRRHINVGDADRLWGAATDTQRHGKSIVEQDR